MRIVFAGTPAPAVIALDRLAATHHEVGLVVTRPAAFLGRKRVLTPSPVAERAAELGLPVLPATRLGSAETAAIAAAEPDLGVIVAYGGLVRSPLLETPRFGWINVHFSLLPRWRGAAPVQRAVIAGDDVTGVSVFRLDAGLDTGPLFAQRSTSIGALETAGNLLERLARIGADVLAGVVDDIAAGTAVAEPQSGAATLAPKLELVDGRIDWSEDAGSVLARIRGVTPEPGAFTDVAGAGTRLKVLEAAQGYEAASLAPGVLLALGGRVLVGTGDRPVELVTVLPAGRARMPAAAWARGLATTVRLE